MPVEQTNVLAGGRDAATGLPRACAGDIECATHFDCTALHITHKPDRAVMVLDALRLDDAGVVHRTLQQAPRRLGGQQYMAAVGMDQAAVPGQGVNRALVHCDIEQTVTGHIKGETVAGGERYRAEPGRDHAFIAYVGAEQDHITAIGVDRSLIDYRAGAGAGKLVSAGHEVAVGNAEGRGDQPAHVHLRSLGEQDAVRD